MSRVEPEKLREFARELKSFLSFVESIGVTVNGQLFLLRESWQDEQYDRFKEQFDKTFKLLQNFSVIADKEWRFLERKADELENYKKYNI